MSGTDWDLIIRNGTIVDGSGSKPFVADVAITDGVISAIGEIDGSAAQEIDAAGLLVTPGFVDIHTHYDGQATWDEQMTPSSWHGITTAVMGNCGVGFAPCKKEDQDRLVELMEGIEDIPGVVLTEGLSWNWETFPEFMDAVAARPRDIDLAAQVPHAAMRVYVMGERATKLEPANDDDIARMATLAREAVEAGALGFSTSRTINHRTKKGDPTPTLKATEAELTGIANALKDAGSGVLQFVTDFRDPDEELAMLQRIVAASGRPLSVSLAQADKVPELWRQVLAWLDEAEKNGLKILAQVAGRPVGIMMGLNVTLHPFRTCPTYKPLAHIPLSDRLVELKKPEVKAAILQEFADGLYSRDIADFTRLDKTFLLGNPPDYEQPADQSIAARAERNGVTPAEQAYDSLLEDGGHALLYLPFLNYSEFSLEPSLEMMKNPNTVLGLGDGGAHLGLICDASFSTHMLTHWTRDRTRGAQLPVETVVKWHTQDTARAVGLNDRGILAPGYKADINIIDHAGLRLHSPEMVRDLPADAGRLLQRANGYRYTIVSGQITYQNGEWTGAKPGKLVRGAQSAPSMAAAE